MKHQNCGCMGYQYCLYCTTNKTVARKRAATDEMLEKQYWEDVGREEMGLFEFENDEVLYPGISDGTRSFVMP